MLVACLHCQPSVYDGWAKQALGGSNGYQSRKGSECVPMEQLVASLRQQSHVVFPHKALDTWNSLLQALADVSCCWLKLPLLLLKAACLQCQQWPCTYLAYMVPCCEACLRSLVTRVRRL